ncbi:hypothetical protein GCM10010468_41340 [Actinocorallia longicatena]|uniref:Uncharacterized protein n=1 Tax=Actinocorallia longicatena TaxID=111803 RepID=A0ABP6QF40_9ACTN
MLLLVVLVVVLVVLGMRAGRRAEDDDDWMSDEPQAQRARLAEQAAEQPGTGFDLRVAGTPMPAPTGEAPKPRRSGRANEQMEDDDYWATITFDKPKFPWQHDNGQDPSAEGPDPLAAAAQRPEPVHAAPVAPAASTQAMHLPAGQHAQADDGYGDQYGDGQYGDGQYGDGQYADGDQYGNDQYADTGYGDGYSDEYAADPYANEHEPHDVPVAGGYDPDPLPVTPLRPDPLEPSALDWQNSEPLTRFDQPPVRPFEPAAPAAYEPPSYDKPATPSYEPAAASYDTPSYETPAYDKKPSYETPSYETPSYEQPSYTAPRPADPLGLPDPFARPAAESRDPEATQAYPAVPSAPLGGAPLSTTGPLSPPALSGPLSTGPTPAYSPAPAASAEPGFDTDGHRLPTVDELLQRIQADRRKDGPSPATPSYSSGSLTDPLNDPLLSGDRDASAYGSSWSSSGTSGGSSYSSGSSSSYGGESYPSAPAYGAEPARYDDPLPGQGAGSGYGSSASATGGQEAGRYTDFTGSSFNGAAGDPQQEQQSSGYYAGEQGFYGAPTGDTPGYPAAPYGEQNPRPSDEWDTYRQHRP